MAETIDRDNIRDLRSAARTYKTGDISLETLKARYTVLKGHKNESVPLHLRKSRKDALRYAIKLAPEIEEEMAESGSIKYGRRDLLKGAAILGVGALTGGAVTYIVSGHRKSPDPPTSKKSPLSVRKAKHPVCLNSSGETERTYSSSEKKLDELIKHLDSPMFIPWGEKVRARRYDPERDYALECGNFEDGQAVFMAEGVTKTTSLTPRERRALLKAMNITADNARTTPLQISYNGRDIVIYGNKLTVTDRYLVVVPDMENDTLSAIPQNIARLSNELVIEEPDGRDADGNLFVTAHQEDHSLKITANSKYVNIRTVEFHPIELSKQEMERRQRKNDGTITVNPI